MIKQFKRALVTGRFQNFHKEHWNNIWTAAGLAEEVVVVIGSAQESGTERNPFSAELRKIIMEESLKRPPTEGMLDIFKMVMPPKIKIVALNDLTDETDVDNVDWGKYLLDFVSTKYDSPGKPDLILYGDDGLDVSPIRWFSNEDRIGIYFLQVPRATDSISGTQMREYMLMDDKIQWTRFAAPNTERYYGLMRETLLNVDHYRTVVKDRGIIPV